MAIRQETIFQFLSIIERLQKANHGLLTIINQLNLDLLSTPVPPSQAATSPLAGAQQLIRLLTARSKEIAHVQLSLEENQELARIKLYYHQRAKYNIKRREQRLEEQNASALLSRSGHFEFPSSPVPATQINSTIAGDEERLGSIWMLQNKQDPFTNLPITETEANQQLLAMGEPTFFQTAPESSIPPASQLPVAAPRSLDSVLNLPNSQPSLSPLESNQLSSLLSKFGQAGS